MTRRDGNAKNVMPLTHRRGAARQSRKRGGDATTRRRGEKISCSKNKKLKPRYAASAEEAQRRNESFSLLLSASPLRPLRLYGESGFNQTSLRALTPVPLKLFVFFVIFVCSALPSSTLAHPLGQLSINHFTRITTGNDRAQVRYVIDLAEIPTFQEAQTADADGSGSLSRKELDDYLERVAPGYIANLELSAGGQRIGLQPVKKEIGLLPGTSSSDAMGLVIMRIVFELEGGFTNSNSTTRFRFEDKNQIDRAGWREIVIVPFNGVKVFDSSFFGNGVTDELKAYPEDPMLAPLNERIGEWSATRGAIPAGATPLTMRDGKPVSVARDRFAELISVPRLTPSVILIGLLFAFALGSVHAMSPGHGKTIVGAYLVGTRGTAWHAAFLGLTVTITHTLGVFMLGLAALFASRYFLPEKIFPLLSFISGALVVVIGLSLFIKRLRILLSTQKHDHHHPHHHHHHHHDDDHHEHDRHHDHDHDHAGHSHLPSHEITWRSLLALGISGGIMPCPSALVVMLASISLDRVGYGLILIVAFSLGLASVLTAVGLVFVYGSRLIDLTPGSGKVMRIIPVASALAITVVGSVICYQALQLLLRSLPDR